MEDRKKKKCIITITNTSGEVYKLISEEWKN